MFCSKSNPTHQCSVSCCGASCESDLLGAEENHSKFFTVRQLNVGGKARGCRERCVCTKELIYWKRSHTSLARRILTSVSNSTRGTWLVTVRIDTNSSSGVAQKVCAWVRFEWMFFVKPSAWSYLQLDWINLYRNAGLVLPKWTK